MPDFSQNTMPVIPVNWLAILVAAVISMVIGFLWYSPSLFGNQWIKLSGFTKEKMKGSTMGKIYGISFVVSLVTAFILTHALVFAGSFLGTKGVNLGLMTGFWNWLGFIMPVQLTGWLFERKPFNLFLINTGYQLASLVGMGIVLALWM